MTDKRTERAWHYHADGGWPYIEIDAGGGQRGAAGTFARGRQPAAHAPAAGSTGRSAPGQQHSRSPIPGRARRSPIFAATGGSVRLYPHDWQPVRSIDRPEGLQLVERCAGCGAGQTTITAPNGEYRTIATHPDPLPAGCPQTKERERGKQ